MKRIKLKKEFSECGPSTAKIKLNDTTNLHHSLKDTRTFPMTYWFWVSQGDKFYEFDIRDESPEMDENMFMMDLLHSVDSDKTAIEIVKRLLTPPIIDGIVRNIHPAVAK